MRAAVYFTPPADDPLTQEAALWLGRCAYSGGRTRAGDMEIDPLVTDPARYGFHATQLAPFRPVTSSCSPDLDAALADFASTCAPVDLGGLQLATLAGFVALRAEEEVFIRP